MKMKFAEDKFYDGELIYEKDKVYDVPEDMAPRWEKRGGVLVEEEPVEPAEEKGDDSKQQPPVVQPKKSIKTQRR